MEGERMRRLWDITINGVKYTNKDGTPVSSVEMWTAVSRCLKAHFQNHPKQRYSRAEISVKRLRVER